MKVPMKNFVEEICDLSSEDQAEKNADFFAATRNLYEPVNLRIFQSIYQTLTLQVMGGAKMKFSQKI